MTPSEVKENFLASVGSAERKLAPTLEKYTKNGKRLSLSRGEIDRIAAEVLRLARRCPGEKLGQALNRETFASFCLTAIQSTTIAADLFNFGCASQNMKIGDDISRESAEQIFGEFCAVVFTVSSGAKLSSITEHPELWESLVRSMTAQGKSRRYEFPSMMLARQFPHS